MIASVSAWKCPVCGALSEDKADIERCVINHEQEKVVRRRVGEKLLSLKGRRASLRYEGHHPISIALSQINEAMIEKITFIGLECRVAILIRLGTEHGTFQLEDRCDAVMSSLDRLLVGQTLTGMHAETLRLT